MNEMKCPSCKSDNTKIREISIRYLNKEKTVMQPIYLHNPLLQCKECSHEAKLVRINHRYYYDFEFLENKNG